MEIRVEELSDTELDYWVAKSDPSCEGLRFEWRDDERAGRHWVGIGEVEGEDMVCVYGCKPNLRAEWGLQRRYKEAAKHCFQPSRNWAQGGAIIEREGLNLRVHCVHNREITSWACEKEWPMEQELGAVGPTPLIAAMRAFVINKHGDKVLANDA